MFFQKKIDKSIQLIKDKDKIDENKEFETHYDPKAEWEEENSGIKLEKGDIPALILSGLLVLSPIFIILILIMLWAIS